MSNLNYNKVICTKGYISLYFYGMPILIYRICIVYVSYIYRVSIVIDSGSLYDLSYSSGL